MKRISIYTAVCLLGLSVSLTSCEDMFGDFLDKAPSNELTEEQTFKEWETMRQFHFDTYNYLRHGACRINNSWMDAATDLAVTSYANAGTRLSFNIGNYYASAGATELTDTWEHYYRAIRKCNMLLTRIDDVPKPMDEANTYEVNKMNYKGESRFLRAYFFWELFLRYGAIPQITEVLDPNGDLLSNYRERPSVKNYIHFIIKELNECEAQLMDKPEEADRAGRICKPMARALLSRIKLYMASDRFSSESGVTWADAAATAKSFIEDYGNFYSLNIAYGDNMLKNAHDEKNPETIFWRNDGQMGWLTIVNDTPVGEGGNGGLCPSQNLIDMYDMADGTSPFKAYDETGAPVYKGLEPELAANSTYKDTDPYNNRDPRLAASILYQGVNWGNGQINVIKGQRDNPIGNANATPTGYYVRKYIPENILLNNHTGVSYRNWTIIRYAEILLNYAEALNENGGSREDVLNTLQPIRNRAGMTAKLVDRSDLQTQEERRNFIRKERTVELAFEDHRAWDVRRWNVAEKALGRDIIGMEVTTGNGDEITFTRKKAQSRVFESKMYLYPIPETEVWKTNIENNPGWK